MKIEEFFEKCEVTTAGEFYNSKAVQVNPAFQAMEAHFLLAADEKVLVFKGDCKLSDNLQLDYEYDKHPSQHCQDANSIRVFIVDGNLELEKALLNKGDEYGVGLQVAGNLKAQNLVLGGAACVVGGAVSVEKTSIFHYHSGYHNFLGGFKTHTLIAADYSSEVEADCDEDFCTYDDDFPIYEVIEAALAGEDYSEFLDLKGTDKMPSWAWSVEVFSNDLASDWIGDFLESPEASTLEQTLDEVLNSELGIDHEDACRALVACEIVARLLGRWGLKDGFSEEVDEWVLKSSMAVSDELKGKALKAIDDIAGETSALYTLWGTRPEWQTLIADLRSRVSGVKD